MQIKADGVTTDFRIYTPTASLLEINVEALCSEPSLEHNCQSVFDREGNPLPASRTCPAARSPDLKAA
jgi:hypothetical protein